MHLVNIKFSSEKELIGLSSRMVHGIPSARIPPTPTSERLHFEIREHCQSVEGNGVVTCLALQLEPRSGIRALPFSRKRNRERGKRESGRERLVREMVKLETPNLL